MNTIAEFTIIGRVGEIANRRDAAGERRIQLQPPRQ